MVRQTVIDVLNILDKKQDSYIDSAEHVYDACKTIKRHLDDDDLIMYIGDFILGLSSYTNLDIDGTLSKCVEMLRALA